MTTTITINRATVEQALEALNVYASKAEHRRTHADDCAAEEAITALRAALAQKHDPVAHSGWVLREVLFDNGEPIGHREPQHSPAALAQQAEPVEPVAWYYERDTDKGLSFAPDRDPYKCWQPLTTPRPQRKPLTDEEIQAAWDSVDMRHPRGNETRIAFARAVERAHGIVEGA